MVTVCADSSNDQGAVAEPKNDISRVSAVTPVPNVSTIEAKVPPVESVPTSIDVKPAIDRRSKPTPHAPLNDEK